MWEQKYHQFHHTNFLSSPKFIFFSWILLQSLWPFPLAFLIYLSCFSFSLTSNLYCSKWLFLLVNKFYCLLNMTHRGNHTSEETIHSPMNFTRIVFLSSSLKNSTGTSIYPTYFPPSTPKNCLTRNYECASLKKLPSFLVSVHTPQKIIIYIKTYKYHREIAALLSVFKIMAPQVYYVLQSRSIFVAQNWKSNLINFSSMHNIKLPKTVN